MTYFKIYQINPNKDHNRIRFCSYDFTIAEQCKIDKSIYDEVYASKADLRDIEDLYEIFNLNRPVDFRGHSMSVSDIVEIIDSDIIDKGFYFCDDIGFKKVTFNEN